MTGRREVQVRTGTGTYPVLIGAGLLERLPRLLQDHAPAHRYAIVSDRTVAELHGRRIEESVRAAGLDVDLLEFPAGEEHKSREHWRRLTDRLLEIGVGRDGVVVAIGGGVTGDLAGFVASTFMRGIPLVQVPTSLVAMIDASVGGKTGVDVPAGKNLVGAFHPPRVVVADPEVIATLPEVERAQGLAEAVKHGAILDAGYLERLDRQAAELLDADPVLLLEAVFRSVELKAEVVSRDEREGGLRKVLNFGHTLGHAIESAAGYSVPHGAAVATGMVLESRIGERIGVTRPGTEEALTRILGRFHLPTSLPVGLDPEDLVRFTQTDKKARDGDPEYVLLRCPGEVDPGRGWSHRVPAETVRAVLDEAAAMPTESP